MRPLIPFLIVCFLGCATGVYAGDEAALNSAMRSFDARAGGADKKLVLSVVSQQTGVSAKSLEAQMKTSHLGYAELIAANSLVEGGGKSLANVLALKGRGKGWAAISKDLKIDPSSIITRVHNADMTLQGGQTKTAQTARPGKPPLPGFTDVRVTRGNVLGQTPLRQ
jgi:hypothetical protein